ncbi:MAG: hypothetical protein ACI8UO_005388 [Verrucomicrobiales bacterium]|jgi:hypothetical protein
MTQIVKAVPGGTLTKQRRNPAEAAYIARFVLALLAEQTNKTIGIVTFSEAQQTEIDEALDALAEDNPVFEDLLSAERNRQDDNQWQGLFVKNLENVQGDERDIIILSICYGSGPKGEKMRMNFGPINQAGGEKRLNVIFSRARQHMVVVSSIRHQAITNDWNDGARCLKRFLEYAAAVSRSDDPAAERALEFQDANRQPTEVRSTVESIAKALREKGHEVEINVGQSRFRVDLAVRASTAGEHMVAVLVDGEERFLTGDELDRAILRPGILCHFGWSVCQILTKDWHERSDKVISKIEGLLSAPTLSKALPQPDAIEPAQKVRDPSAKETSPNPIAEDSLVYLRKSKEGWSTASRIR